MITCERLWDYSIIVQTISAVWDEISEDNAPPYQPDMTGEIWVGLFADKQYIGMYRFNPHTSVLWEGHVFMLPNHRGHSIDGGLAIQGWLVDNIPTLRKMIVNIPECFPNVIEFVKKIGLKEQGYNSDSYTKDGVVGMYQYGITFEEMKWQQQQQ